MAYDRQYKPGDESIAFIEKEEKGLSCPQPQWPIKTKAIAVLILILILILILDTHPREIPHGL